MEIIKQTIGIDISKDDFVVRHGTTDTDQEIRISGPETFSNSPKGFNKLIKWVEKIKKDDSVPLYFIMEATGVYYENLAYFLSEKEYNVCVLLPNKAKNYAKTLEGKSKTDPIDARTLTQFGLERKLVRWEIPNQLFKELKSLTRERMMLQTMKTQLKNRLHAKTHSYAPSKTSIKRIKSLISNYKKLIKAIEEEITVLLESDEELYRKVKRVMSIKGVGIITIASILAETNGFALIRSRKQLASYAGLDVVLNESGKRRGKTKISKKGNKHLRQAVYMPALSAIRWNKEFNNLFIRIVRKKSIKKVGVTAVSRKLLLLVYTLWKKDEEFIPNFQAA
jgi:transposase